MATASGSSGQPSPALKKRTRRVFDLLGEEYPDAHCELDFRTPFELLVATVLAAQCTDARVNQVTPSLFSAYPDARALAAAPRERIEDLIRSTGFFRAKTDSLLGLSRDLVERFEGEVPATLDDLITLRGVGRKTANVVLGDAFGIPGITVDTHVGRLARRLGFSVSDNPEVVERDLGALIDERDWTTLSHRLIFHGRRRCLARKPGCDGCVVNQWCPASTV
jgi:endonuclease-3